MAQEHWRLKGLKADVVILNEHPASYRDEMHEQLVQVVDGGPWAGWKDRPGGVFLLRGDGMPDPERVLLSAVARAVLTGDGEELAPQLSRGESGAQRCLAVCARRRVRGDETPEIPPLVMHNGLGGFTPDGREYVIVLEGERETPLPWSNVIANPSFGTIVTERGGGSHMVREQPREPVDAIRERSRSAIRRPKPSSCAMRRAASFGRRRRVPSDERRVHPAG